MVNRSQNLNSKGSQDIQWNSYYKISNLIGEVYRTEYPLTTKVKNLIESYYDLELLINRLISFASEDNKVDYIELYDKCKRIILAIDRTLK